MCEHGFDANPITEDRTSYSFQDNVIKLLNKLKTKINYFPKFLKLDWSPVITLKRLKLSIAALTVKFSVRMKCK